MRQKNTSTIVFGIFTLLILIFATAYFIYERQNLLNNSGYKAVFLNNGQVYFGQIEKRSNDWVRLSDIYYLKMKDQIEADPNADLSLVRLGSELHGPTNEMEIPTQNILFIETLSIESRVLKAIHGE
ncbi:hypothetical protein KJ632_01270 [Patescibacteria group bacterium]|nr:hypothetical protein [Patescibacteria group bacterium]